jgi:hypothetical protein
VSDALLLAVFAIHLPFFVWRFRSTGELRYAATSVTFALLVAAYALRVFAPDLHIAGLALHAAVRALALAAAALSLSLLAHRLLFARRKTPAA